MFGHITPLCSDAGAPTRTPAHQGRERETQQERSRGGESRDGVGCCSTASTSTRTGVEEPARVATPIDGVELIRQSRSEIEPGGVVVLDIHIVDVLTASDVEKGRGAVGGAADPQQITRCAEEGDASSHVLGRAGLEIDLFTAIGVDPEREKVGVAGDGGQVGNAVVIVQVHRPALGIEGAGVAPVTADVDEPGGVDRPATVEKVDAGKLQRASPKAEAATRWDDESRKRRHIGRGQGQGPAERQEYRGPDFCS